MKVTKWIGPIILIVWMIFVVYPFIWTFFMSLKTDPEVFINTWAPPSDPQWAHYEQAWEEGGLGLAMTNSFIITIGSVLILAIISPMGAYALSTGNLRGKKIVFYLLLIGMFIAPHMMMVPLYKLMAQLHIVNTFFALIAAYVSSGLPYCVFLIRPAFLVLPKSLEESARVDGLSTFQIYRKIALPLAMPAVIVALILEAVFIWNDLFYPLLLLKTESLFPLPLRLIVFRGTFTIRYGLLSAGIIISAVPMVILYIFFADRIRKGMAAQLGMKA